MKQFLASLLLFKGQSVCRDQLIQSFASIERRGETFQNIDLAFEI